MKSALEYIGSKAASLRNRIADRLIERRLHISTTGKQQIDIADAVAYSTLAYWGIFRVLDRLELRPDDVFVDLGCGKGRVVCSAAMRQAAKVMGVDIDERLCEMARGNADLMRHRQAPIEIINMPVQQFDYRDCTALFLFNPFGPGTLGAVLKSVIESLKVNPRAVRLAYVNPRHDQVFADADGFERYEHWPQRRSSRLKFAVSFWRSG